MQVRAGKDDLGPGHHRAVRHAPAIGMEHRRDGQQHVGGLQRPVLAEAADQRVQHRRAMRIDDALRSPRRSRRVAHGDRVVLVVRGRHERLAVRIGEQRLIVEQAGGGVDGCAGEGKDDDLLERMLGRELAIERQQDVVDDEEAVVGVARDPADLVGREAQVERVHDAAGGRDAEVALEVRVVVPGQRRDAVALLQAELAQHRRQTARALMELRVPMPAQRLVGQARDDLLVHEQAAGAVEQVVERQRHVHHRRLHGRSPRLQAVWSALWLSRAATSARYSGSSSDITISESQPAPLRTLSRRQPSSTKPSLR